MGPLGALALAGCAADGLPLGAANDGGPVTSLPSCPSGELSRCESGEAGTQCQLERCHDGGCSLETLVCVDCGTGHGIWMSPGGTCN